MSDILEPECHHEEYDVDILTGMATCTDCGYRWLMSPEETEKLCRLQAECNKQMARLEAEGLDVNEPSSNEVISDDGIPF